MHLSENLPGLFSPGLLAAPASSCINQILNFPFSIYADQLKKISAAVAEFAFIIKLIKSPDNCQRSINPYHIKPDSFIQNIFFHSNELSREISNYFSFNLNFPVFVYDGLKNCAVSKTGNQQRRFFIAVNN